MRKFISIILLSLLVAGISMIHIAAETDKVTVLLDSAEVTFPDAQPFIDTRDRTLVPIRFVSEAMQAHVNWEEATRTVIIEKGSDIIRYTIGQPLAYLNGEMITFDSFGILKESRTFVPLRLISEMLSCDVDWEAETKTVIITSPGEAVAFPEPEMTVHYPESEFDKRLFWITLDNYRDFARECPNYEFKIEFLEPTQLNSFEQDEGVVNGWQQYTRVQFVSLTYSNQTILSVSRAYYTTREAQKTYIPHEGDTLSYKLTVHRKCSDETREYTFTDVLRLPYPLS